MTYQRNILLSENRLDDRVPDRVQSAQIGARDDHEPDGNRRALAHLTAVRPLHALELGPRRAQEVAGASEPALARAVLDLVLLGALGVTAPDGGRLRAGLG